MELVKYILREKITKILILCIGAILVWYLFSMHTTPDDSTQNNTNDVSDNNEDSSNPITTQIAGMPLGDVYWNTMLLFSDDDEWIPITHGEATTNIEKKSIVIESQLQGGGLVESRIHDGELMLGIQLPQKPTEWFSMPLTYSPLASTRALDLLTKNTAGGSYVIPPSTSAHHSETQHNGRLYDVYKYTTAGVVSPTALTLLWNELWRDHKSGEVYRIVFHTQDNTRNDDITERFAYVWTRSDGVSGPKLERNRPTSMIPLESLLTTNLYSTGASNPGAKLPEIFDEKRKSVEGGGSLIELLLELGSTDIGLIGEAQAQQRHCRSIDGKLEESPACVQSVFTYPAPSSEDLQEVLEASGCKPAIMQGIAVIKCRRPLPASVGDSTVDTELEKIHEPRIIYDYGKDTIEIEWTEGLTITAKLNTEAPHFNELTTLQKSAIGVSTVATLRALLLFYRAMAATVFVTETAAGGVILTTAASGLVGTAAIGIIVAVAAALIATYPLWGLAAGDPHITTLDGARYSYQAAGEFVHYRSDNLEVQTRFDGRPGAATFTKSTAIRVGGHTVQLDVDGESSTRYVEVVVDGVRRELGFEPIWLDGFSLLRRDKSGGGNAIVALAHTGELVRVQNVGNAQTVEVGVPPDTQSVGLLGSADRNQSNDFTTRTGEIVSRKEIRTLQGLYSQFGESWRVKRQERLFSDDSWETYRSEHYMTIPADYPGLSRFTVKEQRNAFDRCIAAGVIAGPAAEDCAFDILASGDERSAFGAAKSGASMRVAGVTSVVNTVKAVSEKDVAISAAHRCETDSLRSMIKSKPTLVYSVAEDSNASMLMIATDSGCYDSVRLLLESGAPVNYLEPKKQNNALYLASIHGHHDIVGLLLEAGANPNASTIDGDSPILAASFNGDLTLIKLLIDAGVSPNASRLTDGVLPIHATAQEGHVEALRMLVEAGADLTRTTHEGRTSLMSAVVGEKPIIVQELLNAGVDANMSKERTPLEEAALRGNDQIVLSLIAADADPKLDRSIVFALQNGSKPVLERLLNAGANPNHIEDDQSLLHLAVIRENRFAVEKLLNAGADPDLGPSRSPLEEAILRGIDDVVGLLMEFGANPNFDNSLAIAVEGGSAAVVDTLLKSGVSPNSTHTTDGTTPLIRAAIKGSLPMVTLLVEAGADLEAKWDSLNAASHARNRGHHIVADYLSRL